MKKAFTLLLAMLVLMTVAGAVPAVAEATIDYGFEQGENDIPAGWRANTSTAWEWVENAETAKEGEKYITVSSGIFYTELTSDITAGDTYSIGFWYKGEPRVIVYKNGEIPDSVNKIADSNTAAALTAAEDWTWAEMTVTPEEDVTGCIIELRNKNNVPTSYDGMTVCVKANNLLADGGFEVNGWTVSNGGEVVSGITGANGNCLKAPESSNVKAEQSIDMQANQTYKISFKAMSPNEGAPIRVQFGKAVTAGTTPMVGVYMQEALPAKDTWYSYTAYFTSTEATANAPFYIRGNSTGITVYYDDFCVEAVKDKVFYHTAELALAGSNNANRYLPVLRSLSPVLETLPAAGETVYAHFRANSADAAKKFLAMTCVYETEGGKTKLYNAAVALAGTETEAAAAHTTFAVNVPASAGGKTYTVKSFMWDSTAGLNPYMKVAVLQ